MIYEKSGTWKELSDAISVIVDDPDANDEYMYIKNVISKRIEQENKVGNDIGSCNTKIYHDLENKNFDNIVKYIDRHYSYNLNYILLTYSDFLARLPKQNELFEQITLIINKYTNEEIRETLFGHFKSFDQILDQVKFLKPKEDNEKYNIDALYETLLHIARRKMQAPQTEHTLFAPCSLCWRPALRRGAPVGHFRCPAHFYRKMGKLPARKRAYTRALNITKNMNTWLDRRILIKKLLEHFPSRDLFGGMILFEWPWWRDDSQILDIFKDIAGVCYLSPVRDVTINSIPNDITTVRLTQELTGCFHNYFFSYVVVDSGGRPDLLFRRDSR